MSCIVEIIDKSTSVFDKIMIVELVDWATVELM
jgi:hypothetical protein